MAVKNAKTFRRAGLFAAALASVAVPAVASADPGWRGRDRGESVRQDRGDEGRPGRGWQQQQQAAPQQSQAPQRRPDWAPAQQPQQQGGWSRAPAPQPSAPQGGWNRAPAPQQAEQSGWAGRRGGSDDDRRPNWQGRVESRSAPVQPAQETRHAGGGWAGNDGYRRDGDWRDRRDTSRTGHWDPRRQSRVYHNGGYYNGGYNWDRRWRDNYRYDWHTYRNRYPSYYRAGVYYAPYRNYSYRRLSIGFFLDSLFFGDRYWINNPYQYRLPDVYGPYRWVRYYDDAVLVDTYSGEVVDVIYDFFW